MDGVYDVHSSTNPVQRSLSLERKHPNKISTTSSRHEKTPKTDQTFSDSRYEGPPMKITNEKTDDDEMLHYKIKGIYEIDHEASKNMLVRVYSENEQSNFNAVTGRRMYDDLKYRPIHHEGTRVENQSKPIEMLNNPKRRHSTSVGEDVSLLSNRLTGYNAMNPTNDMQDEYIPDFDFSDTVAKWQHEDTLNDGSLTNNPRQNSVGLNCYNNWTDYEADYSHSSSVSSSSLLMKSTHAQVAPIPLPNARPPLSSPRGPAHDESNQLPFIKVRPSGSSYNRVKALPSLNTSVTEGSLRFKRQKSTQEFESPSSPWSTTTGSLTSLVDARVLNEDLQYITKKLPDDFMSLPYSQRKKIILDLLPGKDHKSIMSLLKKQFLVSSKSSTQLKRSRSRQGSLASQFLSSFTPSSSSFKPNDKGNVVMGYKLGNIIGFGAWGMIRECYQATTETSQLTDYDSPQRAPCKDDRESSAIKAIKVVRFRNNEIVKKHVLKEVQIWSKLKHPHILPLINWKLEDDYAIYCLTERIHDGTLYDLVTSWGESSCSSISLQERCRLTAEIACQIVSALKYMHSNCVVHGDIKLENCLLEESTDCSICKWQVLLCDFGMSSHFGHSDPSSEGQLCLENDENVMFNSPVDGKVLSMRRRPSIPKSASQVSLRPMTKLQKIMKNKKLTHDDTPLGVSAFPKHYGPAVTSAHISERFRSCLNSSTSVVNLKRSQTTSSTIVDSQSSQTTTHVEFAQNESGPNPHSHIGSLPYAAPELLEPAPPPLGPAADIWAFGVTLYTMLTGKLPFKHDYEPRLRAIITSGKYDIDLLAEVCNHDTNCEVEYDKFHSELLSDVIKGCLQKDLTRRWELQQIENALIKFSYCITRQKSE